MSSIYSWSTTPANNQTSDSDINWREGQPPNTVNNSARAMMARVREMLLDISGGNASGGTANTITLTASSFFESYSNGRIVVLRAALSNNSTVTLNVNGIGARPVYKFTTSGPTNLAPNDIRTGGIYMFCYSAALNSGNGAWVLLTPSVQTVQNEVAAATTDATISTPDLIPFLDVSASSELNTITLENLALAVVASALYTGNNNVNTDYPISETLLIFNAIVPRNGLAGTVRLSAVSTANFVNTGSGTAVAGTWRGRGSDGTNSYVRRTL